MDKANGHASAEANPHVEAVLRKAQEELRKLKRQRLAVTRRIGFVKQTIVSLIKLFGNRVSSDDLRGERRGYRCAAGITDSCRRILMEASGPVSSREVRDLIQQTAPALLAHHKDPLATITTVLGRLVVYGEAQAMISDDGQRVWQWSAYSDSNPDQDNQLHTPENSLDGI
jgi:hypothetical protein